MSNSGGGVVTLTYGVHEIWVRAKIAQDANIAENCETDCIDKKQFVGCLSPLMRRSEGV